VSNGQTSGRSPLNVARAYQATISSATPAVSYPRALIAILCADQERTHVVFGRRLSGCSPYRGLIVRCEIAHVVAPEATMRR